MANQYYANLPFIQMSASEWQYNWKYFGDISLYNFCQKY